MANEREKKKCTICGATLNYINPTDVCGVHKYIPVYLARCAQKAIMLWDSHTKEQAIAALEKYKKESNESDWSIDDMQLEEISIGNGFYDRIYEIFIANLRCDKQTGDYILDEHDYLFLSSFIQELFPSMMNMLCQFNK